jgi:cytochrome c oxidase cbb3-type subunit 3
MIEQLFGGSNETINILGGIGFFAVVIITVYVMWVYIKKIKSEKSEGKLAEENWDGIGEYKNDLPTGWTVITILLIIWAGWYYLIGYPVNSYSQIGEWNQENEEYKAKFQSTWEGADAATLTAMGESIYLAKCAACHGLTADGLDGKAANLVEYGTQDHIEHVITNGSKGLGYPGGEMPAGLMAGASSADVKAVASYVAKGMQGAGKDQYNMYCASCHGEDGKGMYGTFPDLTVYGSVDFAINAIKHGKKGNIGEMPSFAKEGTMTDIQYKAVSTYILSLGQ